MTPAEVIASVTSQQHRLDESRVNWEGDPLCCCGASPDDWDNHWAEVAVNALAAAGLVVVSAEDLREYLFRGPNVLAASSRLCAALPERTETDA